MAEEDRLKHLRSNVPGKVPAANKMVVSQLAVNFPDRKLYTKTPEGDVVTIGGGTPLTVVDLIVEDTNTSYPVGSPAKYLVQRKNASSFTNMSQSIKNRIALATHAQQVATLTVAGTPTAGGNYVILGRTVAYTTGQATGNLANEIATELGFITGVGQTLRSVTRSGNTLTITWNAFAEQPALPTLSANGINITTAITTVGGNGDDLWGVVESDGTNWRVAFPAEEVNYSVVAEKSAPKRLVQITDPTLRAIFPQIQLEWAQAGEYPTAARPTTATTSKQVHVTPAIVEDMIQGLTKYEDLTALDLSKVNALNTADYKIGKTFLVTVSGRFTVDGSSGQQEAKFGEVLELTSDGWTKRPLYDPHDYHGHTVSQSAHGFVTGDVVYFQDSTNSYQKAKADSIDTSGIVAVVRRIDDNSFEAVFSGIMDGISGLDIGKTYYVSQTTAGAVTASQPSTGLIKFVYQAIEGGKVVVLPMIAYDAGSSSGGGGVMTRQQILNSITQNGTEGADKFLAGDGIWKSVGNLARLFSTQQTAGNLTGQSPTYNAVSGNADITGVLSGQILRAVGVVPQADYSLTLKDTSFVANGVSIIVNQSNNKVTVKADTKVFFVPQKDKANAQQEFDIQKNEYVILLANQLTGWQVMHSGYDTEINDNAADTATDRTYSVRKIREVANSLSTANRLFNKLETAGKPIGGVNQTYPETQNSVEITITNEMDGQYLRFVGVTINDPNRVPRLIMDNAAYKVNSVFLVVNESNQNLFVASSTKDFRVPVVDQVVSQNAFDLRPNEFAIMIANGGTAWHVLHSRNPTYIQDDAAADVTNRTYSVKKILESITALIADTTASSTTKTWSIDKIKTSIAALISDSSNAGGNNTWSIDKIKSSIKAVSDVLGALIDDASYASDKVWSSKKTQDYTDLAQTHRLVADSLNNNGTVAHFDAFYRASMIRKKQADIVSGRDVAKWFGSDNYGRYMNLPSDLNVSGKVSGRPGFYSGRFDGTTYGEVYSAGGSALRASDIMDDREFSVFAVIRPKSLPAGVNISQENNYAAIVHTSGAWVLGFAENTLNFSVQDNGNNWLRVSHRIDADLDKDMVIIAHKDANDRVSLEVRIDGKVTKTQTTPMVNDYRGAQTNIIEIGRGTNNTNWDGELMELAIINGGHVWDDKDDYFNYFARKWGVDI